MFGLDKNRRPRRYIDNQFEAWGEVVIDYDTGLIWQKAGSENYMRDQDAQKYIQQLNQQRFGGYADWRLPTIPELLSLLEPTEKNLTLYIAPLFDAQQLWCWSADEVAGTLGSAWYVSFVDGTVDWHLFGNFRYVRAVRSVLTPSPTHAPRIQLRRTPRTVSKADFRTVFGLDENLRPRDYIDNQFEARGDDVMIDHATGLMWQQSGSPNGMNYSDVQQYIRQLNQRRLGGYADWRLPTIPELMSLMEPTQKNDRYIDPMFDAAQWWCWSSDLRIKDESSSESAWGVSFYSGTVSWGVFGSDGSYVRAVRS